jgi:GntR family transcriptional regulator, trigonelline degradation regulator
LGKSGAHSDLRIVKVVAPVRQQLVDTIRRAIFEFRFQPGEKLIERELCEMTGVSRTALREGLRQLEAEGLIEILPNKGPMVAKVTPRQASEIYDIRILLEGYAGRIAALKAMPADVKKLRQNLAVIRRVLSSKDRIGIISAKAEFYSNVLSIVGNDELTDILRRFFGQMSLLWPTMIVQSSEAEGSVEEIGEIIDAIGSKDPVRAEIAFQVHMRNAQRLTGEYIASGEWDAQSA